ncbi:hypothetical protein TcG_05400 [Trypanosoma cruzi]|nr:hypothetical protein TcG_05400 [Trypanosoma cruzi]
MSMNGRHQFICCKIGANMWRFFFFGEWWWWDRMASDVWRSDVRLQADSLRALRFFAVEGVNDCALCPALAALVGTVHAACCSMGVHRVVSIFNFRDGLLCPGLSVGCRRAKMRGC